MKKLLTFFEENKSELNISYITFKKYLFDNLKKYDGIIKIVENKQRKSYFILDEENFLRIFKA